MPFPVFQHRPWLFFTSRTSPFRLCFHFSFRYNGLLPQWFTVQKNKKCTKSHNAAMSPLATRDGHRKRKRKRSDAVHLARGAHEVRHGTSSIHFHCAVPRSSSHIRPRLFGRLERFFGHLRFFWSPHNRVALWEPNRNRKPAPSEPFLQEPNLP